MRNKFILALLMLCAMTPMMSAQAEVNVSIGVNLATYPDLVPVPGYPVYYSPDLETNYFFYDGSYWVYSDDNWYESDWYNGPWELVDPIYVPLYVLRVPVRYYRRPPTYFHGWAENQPPRWDEHWGNNWSQRRSGWNQWNHSAVPARAPLPTYQRRYSGNQYPQANQQRALVQKNYRYQPHHSALPHNVGSQQQPAPQPQQLPHMNNALQGAHPATPQQSNNSNRHIIDEHTNDAHTAQQHRPAPPRVTPSQPPAPRPVPTPAPHEAPHQVPHPAEQSHQPQPEPHVQQRPAPQQPSQRPPHQAPETHTHETTQREHRESPGN